MAEPFIEEGRLFPVPDSPQFSLPAYMAYPRESDSIVLGVALDSLRELARLSPSGEACGAILAPWPEDDALHAEALRLRAQGERVVLALPGHGGTWRDAGCDRILVRRGDNWIIESLKED